MPRDGLRRCVALINVFDEHRFLEEQETQCFFHRWFDWVDAEGFEGVGAVLELEDGQVYAHYDVDKIRFTDVKEAI